MLGCFGFELGRGKQAKTPLVKAMATAKAEGSFLRSFLRCSHKLRTANKAPHDDELIRTQAKAEQLEAELEDARQEIQFRENETSRKQAEIEHQHRVMSRLAAHIEYLKSLVGAGSGKSYNPNVGALNTLSIGSLASSSIANPAPFSPPGHQFSYWTLSVPSITSPPSTQAYHALTPPHNAPPPAYDTLYPDQPASPRLPPAYNTLYTNSLHQAPPPTYESLYSSSKAAPPPLAYNTLYGNPAYGIPSPKAETPEQEMVLRPWQQQNLQTKAWVSVDGTGLQSCTELFSKDLFMDEDTTEEQHKASSSGTSNTHSSTSNTHSSATQKGQTCCVVWTSRQERMSEVTQMAMQLKQASCASYQSIEALIHMEDCEM